MGSFVSSYAKREIFLAASSTKHLVKLFSACTGEESEIVASSSFSRRSTFRQTILKIVLTLSEKLLQNLRSCRRRS